MYYPFGMEQTARVYREATEGTVWGFNGKRIDSEWGMMDFGARPYDRKSGRWLSIDPLAVKYPGFSPYSFAGGNPIFNVDPDGESFIGYLLKAICIFDKSSAIKVLDNLDVVDQATRNTVLFMAGMAQQSTSVNAVDMLLHSNPIAHMMDNYEMVKELIGAEDKVDVLFALSERIGIPARRIQEAIENAQSEDIDFYQLGEDLAGAGQVGIGVVSGIKAAKKTARIQRLRVKFRKSLENLDDIESLGKSLSTKDLKSVAGDLKKTGWKRIDKGTGASKTFYKQAGGKRYYLNWNEEGVLHSSTKQRVKYWKL
ncbi:MAG: RHS repeat-associated core domain-containing protein, partial [Bacteroidota bacterium]